jgi:hypothetical protein
MRAESQLEGRRHSGHFTTLPITAVKKILLPEMTGQGSNTPRYFWMVIDHQADAGLVCDGKESFRKLLDLLGRQFFRPQLEQVSPALAQPLGQRFQGSSSQVSGVDEGVKPAI